MYSPLKIEHIGTVEYGLLHIHESSMSTESIKMLSKISSEIRINLPKLKIRFYDIDFNENNIKNKKNYLTTGGFPFFKPSDTEKIQNAYTYFSKKIMSYVDFTDNLPPNYLSTASIRICTATSHLYLPFVPNLQRYWFYKNYLLWVNRNCISRDDYNYIKLKVDEFILHGNEEFVRLKNKVNRLKELTLSSGNKRIQISNEICSFVLKRDREECVICGSKVNLQFDHILPVSKGGNNEPENLRVLCRDCNLSRGNLSNLN